MNKFFKSVLFKTITVIFSCLLPLMMLEAVIRAFDLFSAQRKVFDTRYSDEAPNEPENKMRFQIHPYLGFAVRPHLHQDFTSEQLATIFPDGVPHWAKGGMDTNVFGLFSNEPDYRSIEGDYVIGIFGGSVAAGFAVMGGDALIEALEKRFSHLRGKIRILNLASEAYKQPQQLNNLILMSLLGIRFDLVLNIDGFNEVVYSFLNAQSGYHPIFPSRAHYLPILQTFFKSSSPEFIMNAARILDEKRSAARLIRMVNQTAMNHSELIKWIFGLVVLGYQKQAILVEARLQKQEDQPLPDILYQLDAPCFQQADQCRSLAADLWGRASTLMSGVCKQIGAQYVHILQPNQYVEGTKPLTEQEIEVAYKPESDYSKKVRLGYPLLKERGLKLASEGISFHDLTNVFFETKDTLYIDECCHFNSRGNEIMAMAVARSVPEVLPHAAHPPDS